MQWKRRQGNRPSHTPNPVASSDWFYVTQVHTSASEQWSLAHSAHLPGQTDRMQPGHRGPVLLRLEVPLRKVGLSTHLGEVFADSLVLGHYRRFHRGLGGPWTLIAHHSWTDDILGRQTGAAHMAAKEELTGWHSLWEHPRLSITYKIREKKGISPNQLSKKKATIWGRK